MESDAFCDSPNKGQALYNFFHGSLEDLHSQVAQNLGENETHYRLRYLKHYYPELATNQLFVQKYKKRKDNLQYIVYKTLLRLIEYNIIEEKDVVDFMSSSSLFDLYEFIEKCFPDKICIKLYERIPDKRELIETIEEFIFMNDDFSAHLTSTIVMAGDERTYRKLLKKMQYATTEDEEKVVQWYFRGAVFKRASLNWINDDIFRIIGYNAINILVQFCASMGKYPDVIVIAKDIFDAMRETISPKNFSIWVLDRIGSKERLKCYEFLFQTGYFPYSYFTDKLPRTPELKQWLLLSTNV